MKGNRRRDTLPELALRRALHARGLRYRVDHLVHPEGHRPVRVDVAFTRLKLAVFVDGCFWHGCPQHGTVPTTNRAYWEPKLTNNVERDRRIDAALVAQGWTVIRIWEHDAVDSAATVVQQALDERGRLGCGATP